MDVGVIGISYRSSEIVSREIFTKIAHELSREYPVVLLATCNRTEVYFTGDLFVMHSLLLGRIGQGMEEKIYSYFGWRCVAHLLKVASGIDSALFAETQVQGQVRRAYEEACRKQKLSSELHYLFQKSLHGSKLLRREFSLYDKSICLESILWDLSRYFFPGGKQEPLLLVGYSQINRRVLSFFQEKKWENIWLATRSEDGQDICKKHGVQHMHWQALAQAWSRFPMVVCASQATDYVLHTTAAGSIETRLVVDLGMPRNVHPILDRDPRITLFNIQDIGDFIESKQKIPGTLGAELNRKIEGVALGHLERFEKKRLRLCVR